MKALPFGLVAALAVLLLAVSAHGVARNVPFFAAFRPLHSVGQPYSGNLRLDFNRGVISGWYSDASIKPGGPLAHRMHVPVTGGVDRSGIAHLTIGPLSFRGHIHGQWISGTATARGRFFESA